MVALRVLSLTMISQSRVAFAAKPTAAGAAAIGTASISVALALSAFLLRTVKGVFLSTSALASTRVSLLRAASGSGSQSSTSCSLANSWKRVSSALANAGPPTYFIEGSAACAAAWLAQPDPSVRTKAQATTLTLVLWQVPAKCKQTMTLPLNTNVKKRQTTSSCALYVQSRRREPTRGFPWQVSPEIK